MLELYTDDDENHLLVVGHENSEVIIEVDGYKVMLPAGEGFSRITLQSHEVKFISSEVHERLISYLKMSCSYTCVEGSKEEVDITEKLLKELGLDDDK